MPTLTITKGLPASGKSTWANEQVRKSNGQIKRVNKDDLRAMLDAGEWSREREKEIIAMERTLVHSLLLDKFDVIVDNTHLGGDHESFYQNLALENGYEFEVKDFTDVPLQTCIDRDSARGEKAVGKKTIMRMYNSYIKQKKHVAKYQPILHNPDLPDCVIVDIDGTLAHMNGREPYDYNSVHTDIVDPQVAEIVRKYAQRDIIDLPSCYIVIVSGRDNTCQDVTEEWLKANGIPYDEIYMRDPKRVDTRGNKLDDTIIKREIYEQFIKPRYNVKFVLDDRDRVVKMWREEGLKVLQVAEGNF